MPTRTFFWTSCTISEWSCNEARLLRPGPRLMTVRYGVGDSRDHESSRPEFTSWYRSISSCAQHCAADFASVTNHRVRFDFARTFRSGPVARKFVRGGLILTKSKPTGGLGGMEQPPTKRGDRGPSPENILEAVLNVFEHSFVANA